MQVELIGCTSAGKSTLTKQMLQMGSRQGIKISTSYDYVLNHYRLGWLPARGIRTIALNLLALWACLRSIGRNSELLLFVLRVLRKLPTTVSQRERLKIARITLRNIGIQEIIARVHPSDQIILADEGAIQVVHYLFVHLASQPNLDELITYLGRIPLPDLVIYYRQPAAVLEARTLARGHKRIPDRAVENVKRFIHHAMLVFEQVSQEASIRDRTIEVDGHTNQIIRLPAVEQARVELVVSLIQDPSLPVIVERQA